jgi:hypothetical protein
MRRAISDSGLRCSFCEKSKDAVRHLISSPSDRSRAYICDECVAVCHSILNDKSAEVAAGVAAFMGRPRGLAFDPMLVPDLLDAVERWTHTESRGDDALLEIDEVRRVAALMFTAPMEQ